MTALHHRIVAYGMADAEPRRLLAEDRTAWGLAVSLVGALMMLLAAIAAVAFFVALA